MTVHIPFNKPYMTGKELSYIEEAHHNLHLSGDGPFTNRCQRWLESHIGCSKALLTHSCTAALEMAAILSEIQLGDEVIMPSYTFVSTANAFVLRGAVPVFIDIRPDTLNIDERKIEAAITPKTKAIVPVHYAGVSCEMDAIMAIAERHNLIVIEDAAQGVMSSYRGRPVGSIGHMAALSFHETKNITCGEGGALLINRHEFIERAEIVWEKGTNRHQHFLGQVDKYTWMDIGSSYLPSELAAAFLWGQMEEAENMTQMRLNIWETYHSSLAASETRDCARRPVVPAECVHNAHMYYLLLPDSAARAEFIRQLGAEGINAVFHYVPLHSSPMGSRCGRMAGQLKVTDSVSDRLVRLPLWIGLEDRLQEVIECVVCFLGK